MIRPELRNALLKATFPNMTMEFNWTCDEEAQGEVNGSRYVGNAWFENSEPDMKSFAGFIPLFMTEP